MRPLGYVPGGSTPRVAAAIQAINRRRMAARRPVAPVRPPVRPGAARPVSPSQTPVDPLWGSAQSTVFGMTSPLISRLAQQRVAAEEATRRAYATHSDSYANAMAQSAAPIGSAYQSAIQNSAKVEDALGARLRGEGEASTGSLAAALAQIGGTAGTGEAAKVWQGAGNAGFATGAADLQHLLGRQGEAQAYQAKLPGIARQESANLLERALSEQRGQFAEQERAIQDNAMQQAWELFGEQRANAREDALMQKEWGREDAQVAQERQMQKAQAAQEAYENAQDRIAKERMALQALMATAQTTAERNQFTAEMKAMDRQNRVELAKLNQAAAYERAQLSAATRLATDNPPAAPKAPVVAGPPNRKYNPDGSLNKNYAGPAKPKPAKPRAIPQGVVERVKEGIAPGGAEFWHPEVLRKLRGSPRAVDGILNARINMLAQRYNLDPTQTKNLRVSLLKGLSGRKWHDQSGRTWTYQYGGK